MSKKAKSKIEIDRGRNRESFGEFARGVYSICSQERSLSETGNFDAKEAYVEIRKLYLELVSFQMQLQAANDSAIERLGPMERPWERSSRAE